MYSVSVDYMAAAVGAIQEHQLTGTIGSINFTEANIVSGSFSIQNQCSDGSGNDIQPGSVIIGELSAVFTGINLTRGQWRNKVITPTFALKVGNTWESVPLGVYKVKEAKHTAEGVQVRAYDNMHKFDKTFKKKRFKYSGTMYQFLSDICTRCHVTLGMTQQQVQALTNGTGSRKIYGLYKEQAANDIKTFRDFLSYIAQATCTFATINRAGQLVLREFGGGTSVDTISDSARLSGAVFEDYETKYNGIFVNDMDTGDEVYYGYDEDDNSDMLTNLQAEQTDNTTATTNLNNEHNAGKISDSDYARQLAALQAESSMLTTRITAVTLRQTEEQQDPTLGEGSSIILGDNPLLQDANITDRDEDRENILARVMQVAYTPFTCSLVCGAHYDLGDVIEFTNGHAGTSTTCCIMGWEYNLNVENNLEGYGSDPDIANVHNLARKKASVAIKDFNDTKVEVNSYYDETNGLELGTISVNGDPKSLYQQRDQTHLEKLDDGSVVVRDEQQAKGPDGNTNTKVFWLWTQNDNLAPETWVVYDVCIKCSYPFMVVDFPGAWSTRIAHINGKTYYESTVYLVTRCKVGDPDPVWKELNTYHEGSSELSRQLTNSFIRLGDQPWGEWREFQETSAHRIIGDYKYYVRGYGTVALYSGLYGMCRPDKHYPSEEAFNTAFYAGEIAPPATKKGDVILPTGKTQKESTDALKDLANTVSGDSDSGNDPNTQMQVEPDSTTDVESENNQKSVADSLNQIKNGISSWIGSIVNHGRGDVVATVKKRDDTTATEIKASTNLTFVENIAPQNSLVDYKHGDTWFRMGNTAGWNIEPETDNLYTEGFDVTTEGFQLRGDSDYESGAAVTGGYIVYKMTGLTVGKNYTFTYSAKATKYTGGTASNPSYDYSYGYRTGHFGVLYSTSPVYDPSALPSESTNTWHSDLLWQNFADLTTSWTSYTNTFAAVAATMYVVIVLDPLVKGDDHSIAFEMKDFKTSDSVFEIVGVWANYDDVWYPIYMGSGTIDYDGLEHRPQINSVTLTGNKTTRDLQILENMHLADFEELTPAEQDNPDKFYFVDDATGSGGGSNTLATLSDVNLASVADGQVLTYDSTAGKWKNATSQGGRTQTLLWDYVEDNEGTIPYQPFSVTLRQSINNFDELVVENVSSSSDLTDQNWKSTNQWIINVSALNNAVLANYISYTSYDIRSSRYHIEGTTFEKTRNNSANTNGLVRVYGVKY